jgi:hypothetical protein
LISAVQSALDFIATVRYESGCDNIVLNKEAICECFFDLKTGITGEILQKFINYYMRIAIIDDFSGYLSNSLKDFIYECNKGRNIFFLPDEKQAARSLEISYRLRVSIYRRGFQRRLVHCVLE